MHALKRSTDKKDGSTETGKNWKKIGTEIAARKSIRTFGCGM
jgi:hypothetical protein